MQIWQPLNLTEACPAHTQLTACSPFGYIFLNLVASLYGGAKDLRIQKQLESENIRYGDQRVDVQYGEKTDNNDEEFDFIVVGAGSAGCVVANRLTEVKKWKVLLLEAGPEQPDITLVPGLTETLLGSNVDWGYTTQPDPRNCLSRPNSVCPWSRGKMMGGSSSINTMVTIRGNPYDYDSWAAAGNVGWSYKEVLPFFKKSEKNGNIEGLNRRYHGVRGPQPVSRFPFIDKPSIIMTEALNELGLPIIDATGPHQVASFQSQAFTEDGVRVSSNNAYIQPIRYKRKNLTVRPYAEVTNILIDKHKRAYGVKYVSNGKVHTATARKDIILSAGTIDSAKLLLLSGIGPRKHLEDIHLPVIEDLAVGKNLQDHLTFTGLVIAFDNETSTLVDHEEIIEHVKEYKEMKLKSGPLSSTGQFNTLGFFKTDENLPAPDIEVQSLPIVLKEYLREPVVFESLKIFPTTFYDAISMRVQNMVTKSRGVLLLNATDPYGPPLIYANYLADPTDMIPVQKGVQFMKNLENTEHFVSGRARFIKYVHPACNYTKWGTNEYTECMLRHYTFSLSHLSGTCKMGPEWDDSAVVDPRLRVYGIAGLRVIDASIMPVGIRGHTNGPAVMIGEKGAAMIKEDWLHNYVQGYKHGDYRDIDN
ncbi:glucose dehydrogenase [FAD, quinone]-like [Pectinophora gossypiella]|uniref:glucose dehydrogenase [FAD, quinone]-like n=1 Tax=Pectinophora gossypiella TaxID=13191 RepID=UPI00214EFC0C|nr:glucose dehydrogenase [FAD, quinone]-like [Pectinophora gossypiella]